MKKVLVLDSNSYISFLEQSFTTDKVGQKPPEDTSILKYLIQMVKKEKLVLMIPEIVIHEVNKHKVKKAHAIDNIFDNLDKRTIQSTFDDKTFNKNILDQIKKQHDAIRKREHKKFVDTWKKIENLFNSPKVVRIPLTPEIFMSAYIRGITGNKPYSKKHTISESKKDEPLYDIQPDCIIVESIKQEINKIESVETYMCTYDNGFYTGTDKADMDDVIKQELKIVGHYYSVRELLEQKFNLKKRTSSEEVPIPLPITTGPLVGSVSSPVEIEEDGLVKGESKNIE